MQDVRSTLSSLVPHLLEMRGAHGALCDGGDVLFTGKEIFCGLSNRTNMDGSNFLQKSFPEFPVFPAIISGGSLHLKSLMSMVGNTILFADTPAGVMRRKKTKDEEEKKISSFFSFRTCIAFDHRA